MHVLFTVKVKSVCLTVTQRDRDLYGVRPNVPAYRGARMQLPTRGPAPLRLIRPRP